MHCAVGEPLGTDIDSAAQAIIEIVDENMASAARVHAVEKGSDVTQRTLIAFGGGAPLHALAAFPQTWQFPGPIPLVVGGGVRRGSFVAPGWR